MATGSMDYQVCLPIVTTKKGLLALCQDPGHARIGEPMIRSFMHLVKLICNELLPSDGGNKLVHWIRLHKAEVVSAHGFQWWSAACGRNREANVLTNAVKHGKSRRKAYAYVGGGSISSEGADIIQGVVIKVTGIYVLGAVVAAVNLLSKCLLPFKNKIARNIVPATLRRYMVYCVDDADAGPSLFDDEDPSNEVFEDHSVDEVVDLCQSLAAHAEQRVQEMHAHVWLLGSLQALLDSADNEFHGHDAA